MNKLFIHNNITTLSILLFLVIYTAINLMKPSFLYNNDGSLREFGVGLRRKTVIPAWILSIFLSILSYFVLMYYAAPNSSSSFLQ
jgi:hypothetical protein